MDKNIELAKKLLESKGYKITESTKEIDFKKLEKEIRDEVEKVMTSPKFGFSKDEVWQYTVVELKDEEDAKVLEVRGELSYDGMLDMSEKLDPIVAKYDEDAYFDFEDAGIMVAYFQK